MTFVRKTYDAASLRGFIGLHECVKQTVAPLSILKRGNMARQVVAHKAAYRLRRHAHWLDGSLTLIAAMGAFRFLFVGNALPQGNALRMLMLKTMLGAFWITAGRSTYWAYPVQDLIRIKIFCVMQHAIILMRLVPLYVSKILRLSVRTDPWAPRRLERLFGPQDKSLAAMAT